VARTVEVGASVADAAGRIVVSLELDESATASTDALRRHMTVPASQLAIPDGAQKELEAARLRLARSDADGAITHLERAIEIAPRFMTAWNELGVIAYQSARYNDAERDFRMALSADPDAYEPLVNLGGVLLNLGHPYEALQYNLNAALRRPRDPLANSQLGMSYYLTGKLDLAEQYLIAARKLDPAHFSHPQLILAEIHLRRNDRAAAIEELKDFLARHPDSGQAAQVKAEIARLSAL
jgi:Tfp pilus assembly protein PilF